MVASVSCIYGIGNPSEFRKHVTEIMINQKISITKLLSHFVKGLYSRSIDELNRGSFRVNGDIIDIFPSYSDIFYRINFLGMKLKVLSPLTLYHLIKLKVLSP